jgi:hypothetical protein
VALERALHQKYAKAKRDERRRGEARPTECAAAPYGDVAPGTSRTSGVAHSLISRLA